MTTEQQAAPTPTPAKKMGRPRKEKKGVYLWLPAEFSDSVIAYLELLKQQHNQRQAKQ